MLSTQQPQLDTPPATSEAVCPSCGQPTTLEIGDHEHRDCRNEACPLYGQIAVSGDHAP